MYYPFCTVSTQSHAYKVQALAASLNALTFPFQLHVLWIDKVPENMDIQNNIIHFSIDEIQSPLGQKIIKKYKHRSDALRWSFKSIFILYLLEAGKESVIYVDNDVAFFGDYRFLFDALQHHHALLTPHHYLRDPNQHQNWLEANFRVGLFNAGFIGCNSNSKHLLEWWGECCLYRCEKSAWRGLYDDQKYLDLWPVMDEKVHILRHKGCNVAEWNRGVIARTMIHNEVRLDGNPLIFIHFNQTTMLIFHKNEDPWLEPFYKQYVHWLKTFHVNFDIEKEIKKYSLVEQVKYRIWVWIHHLNQKSISK